MIFYRTLCNYKLKRLPIHQEISSVINVSDINEYQETSVFGSTKVDEDTKIENKSIKEVQQNTSDKSIKTETKKRIKWAVFTKYKTIWWGKK